MAFQARIASKAKMAFCFCHLLVFKMLVSGHPFLSRTVARNLEIGQRNLPDSNVSSSCLVIQIAKILK